MALFPAFGGVSDADNSKNTDQEWLSNLSFSSVDALSLHQRTIHRDAAETHTPCHTHSSEQKPDEDDDEDHTRSKKRRKKEKKTKRKKQKKRSRDDLENSDSDTVYPSDLLNRELEPSQRQEDLVNVGGVLWLDDLQCPGEKLFYMDRKSDPANWEYKSLYRAHITRYKRKGSCALGLDSRTQGVRWEDSAPDRKRKEKRNERYFSPSNRRLLSSETPPTLSAPPTDSTLSNDPASFIPLPPCKEEPDSAPQTSTSTNPLRVYDLATSLWLEGKGQPEVKDQVQPPPSNMLMAQVEEFNRKLRENPTDVNMWLEFIQFQDEVGGSLSGQGAESERALWDRKLSVVERALQLNPGSVELKLHRLRLGRGLWDSTTQLKEWKKVVFIHPNSAPLWRSYILFTQSQFSSFSVPMVTGVYRKCLSTLSAVQDGQLTSHPALPGTEHHLLDVFVNQCHFLRQAGHSEKAVCLFQALIEFTFFKPDNVRDLTTKQQVEFFETFWDSGEPRVGEVGARGWRTWMKQQERGGWIQTPDTEEDDKDDDDDEDEIKDKTQPRWRIWLDVESWREANHWLPWRPDKAKGQSEEECEDPDRQVLFDDIGPSLIRVEVPELRLRLLLSFLHLLGMPISSASSSSSLIVDDSNLLDDSALLDETPDPERPLTSHDLPVTGVSAVGHMTSQCDSRRKRAGLCKQGEEFVRNVLEQTLPLFPPEDRAEVTLCWMQYEKLKVLQCVRSGNKKRTRAQGKCTKRLLKRLLKQQENRSSLSLWREYGHVEWLLGNIDEARRVFDSALTLGGASGLCDSTLCKLCLLYAQLEMELMSLGGAESVKTTPTSATSSRAVYILTKLAEGATYKPFTGEIGSVAILKARKAYEHAVSGGGAYERACALIGCFGLFQYLTVGVDAADAVFTQARENMKCTQQREAVCVLHVALLHHHSSVRAFPLRRVRSALSDALILLPHSVPLWRLHLQADTRYYSAANTRRFLHAVTKGNHSILPRLFTLTTEQQRKKRIDAVLRSGLPADSLPVFPETGLCNRIRSLFEVAVATERGAHCPLLWRRYINFMVCNGDVERGRGIFYRALQHVPWVKVLYMDAVSLFPDRVQEVLDLLMEKELRLRTPMEELDILLED
ncbi:nuclear exosome regulator NRDE2 [Pangasianodon hypophthalmus]|uniref:nuclear exosome regulator NRDE2 n=1 Tax=Pangasianodon hypophthalmus TaxID=310915 RepID=UPI002306F2B8|nr:nuclear exosome regulator NRDE2 [Pangasianodon hypophthalmus]